MEFTVTCPVDGSITVSLEDIDTVVLREPQHAEITFICPHCGESITVHAVIPQFLMAAIEAMAEDTDATMGPMVNLVTFAQETDAQSAESPVTVETLVADSVADAYCEYFRRQLSRVTCVEDALAEIDAER